MRTKRSYFQHNFTEFEGVSSFFPNIAIKSRAQSRVKEE